MTENPAFGLKNTGEHAVDSQVVLEGHSVVLRPLKLSDAQDLFEACQDPEIIRWTTIPSPYKLAHAEKFVSQPPEICWAITAVEFDDRWCGSIEARIPQGQGEPVTLGYMMAPWARGRGMMTAAVLLVQEYLLSQGYEHLEIHVYPDNTASRRTAEKAGFVFQEILENAEMQRGVPRDLAVYTSAERNYRG